MDQFWQVIVTSSVLSTILTLVVSTARDMYKTRRLNDAEAHRAARFLESYARNCEQAIAEAIDLLEKAYIDTSNSPVNGLGIPRVELPMLDGTKLSPSLYDRLNAFPDLVAKADRITSDFWYQCDDEYHFNSLVQEHIADLGQKSFDLAKATRVECKLPLEHAASECLSALEVFQSIAKQKSDRELAHLANLKKSQSVPSQPIP